MKNKEKFAKEILEIACGGRSFAIDKHTGKVVSCSSLARSNCLFDTSKESYKSNNGDCWGGNGRRYCALSRHVNVAFPMIKWEDDKPWLIDDLKKLEVVEEYETN